MPNRNSAFLLILAITCGMSLLAIPMPALTQPAVSSETPADPGRIAPGNSVKSDSLEGMGNLTNNPSAAPPRNVMKYLVDWFHLSYDTAEPSPGNPFRATGRFKSLLFDLPGVVLTFETDGEIVPDSGDFKWRGTAIAGTTVEMVALLKAPGIEKWEIDPGAPSLGVPETIRIPGTLSMVADIPFPYSKLVDHVNERASDLYPDQALREELLEDLAAMKTKADENGGIYRFGRGSAISLYLDTWSFKRADAAQNGAGATNAGKTLPVDSKSGKADPGQGGVK